MAIRFYFHARARRLNIRVKKKLNGLTVKLIYYRRLITGFKIIITTGKHEE